VSPTKTPPAVFSTKDELKNQITAYLNNQDDWASSTCNDTPCGEKYG
jgi:hypothetical protein